MSTSKAEKLLAREVVQNSVDARREKQVPEVRFLFENNKDVTPVIDPEFRRHASAAKIELGFDPRRAAVLYVEDFRTTGLTGSLRNMSSRVAKLILSLGGSEKTATEGGSYGFGKAGAILNSRARAVVAYSLRPEGSMLVGAAYFGHYDLDGFPYSGRALFGLVQDDIEQTREIIDEEADELAVRLGIPRAKKRELGTTLVLIDPPADPNDLKSELETHWWPRLVSGGLDVVIETSGKNYVPMPGGRDDLKPFVELYRLLNKERDKMSSEEVATIERLKRNMGRLALRALEDRNQIPEMLAERLNTVALMRGLGMVVDYSKLPGSDGVDLCGVFIADPQIDDDLRMTEDPKHSSWSEEASRGNGRGHVYAKEIKLGIRDKARKMRENYRPKLDDPALALRGIRRLLGSLLGRPGDTSPNGEQEDIQVRPECRLEPCGNQLYVIGKATITPGSKATPSMEIAVDARISEGMNSKGGDRLRMTVMTADGKEYHGERVAVVVPCEADKPIEVTFTSECYDAEWTVSPRVTAAYRRAK